MIEQIQCMYGLVDHASSARSVPSSAPGLHFIIFFLTVPGNSSPDPGDGAVLTPVNQTFEHLNRLIEAVLQTDTHVNIRVGSLKLHKLPSLFRIERHRLFAEYVNAHLCGSFRHRHMQVVRQTDMDNVRLYFCYHCFIIGVKRHSRRCIAPLTLFRIADSRQGNLRITLNGCKMDGGNNAHSDDSCFFHMDSSRSVPAVPFILSGTFLLLQFSY